MAGSYNHCVDDQGRLLVNEQLQGMLECCSGDVYEAIEEMYGMIWWLASDMAADDDSPGGSTAQQWVDLAQKYYKLGLRLSPGTDGSNPQEL